MCSEGSELIQIHQFLDFCPVSLLPSGLIRLSSKHFKDVMPVTNYNSFPVAVLVFKSREIFKCRMCHLGSRANCLPAPPSSLKPGFAVEFDAVTGLLAISLHCFPHVPSPLRIWLQGINLETSIGSEDRFASLSTVLWVMGSPWIRGPQALHFTQVFFHGPHGCHGRKAKKIFFFSTRSHALYTRTARISCWKSKNDTRAKKMFKQHLDVSENRVQSSIGWSSIIL